MSVSQVCMSACSRLLGRRSMLLCAVTLLDGIVLARSAFHHSMNYRSVMCVGHASLVTDPDEKVAALSAGPTCTSGTTDA